MEKFEGYAEGKSRASTSQVQDCSGELCMGADDTLRHWLGTLRLS